uniref:NADH dehydrogenase subunit 2 n=1 Tax=Laqueus japonicus TaxID=147651 RepID=UPI000EF2EFC2|nr:NADH dehydrogenase subunit 2 [Laqueus japonicus]AYI69530.1 NADH dehydrogenase subunit 2 [Laqueus japonicus]
MVLYTSVLGGVGMSLAASNWILIWVGFEISSICFVVLLSCSSSCTEIYSAFTYFLFQEIGSYLVLIGALLDLNILVTSGLFVKMGAAPFHMWVPMVVDEVTWFNCFLVLVVLKMVPLLLLTSRFEGLLVCGVVSVLWGAFGIVGQVAIRRVLAFSSINQTGWMLLVILYCPGYLGFFYGVYFFIMLGLILFFSYPEGKVRFWGLCFLVGLGGFPPTVGFMLKWSVVGGLVQGQVSGLAFMVTILSVLSLFAYISLGYKILMVNKVMGQSYSLFFVVGVFMVPLVYSVLS